MDLSHFLMWTTIGQIGLPFVLCALLLPLERAFPRRRGPEGWARRWRANALIAVAGVLAALLVGHVMTDRLTQLGGSIGLVSIAALPIPGPAKVISSLLIMDFLAYLLHVLGHKVGALWRLHQIHHSDNHFDASTGLRHQPLEGAINLCVLIVCYAALGLPLVVIAIYGLVFAAHAVFSHANIAIPPRLDRWLRLVIVTPDLHRIHHSVDPREYNGNYGQVLPWWDWMFGTLRTVSLEQQEKLKFGVDALGDCNDSSAMKLILLPFRRSKPLAQRGHGRPRGRTTTAHKAKVRSPVVKRKT
jgi:sterol desaturase/sphingolipid hydroxylase (fatty acid hydroxylase superfamily)